MSQKNLMASKPYTRKKIENYSYGLNDTIGKGYSSQVYKGRNDASDEPVAVKVIDLKMLKNQINRILLNSEIQILKSMRDTPHILTLHEVYTTKNNTYIITQLCESDLSKKIKKGLSQQEAYRFMDQFLQGYAHVVANKLVHRDLKPANLLITHENQLKIADFGFGIKVEEVLKPSKYNVGSPLYMAPESLKRNQYSFKTDIWAIGVIFFQMLTSETPWRAKNEKQLLKKIENERIQTIMGKHKFSPKVREFIVHALTFDKSNRLTPEQLGKYSFQTKPLNILGQKQTNTTIRAQKFQSIINKPSPKNFSAQKRTFKNFEKSDKKNQNSTQNISMKNLENVQKKNITTPFLHQENNMINKQDRKHISKLLIAEVHFCRFLYKLLGRIKQSRSKGIFSEEDEAFDHVTAVFQNFTNIIQHKIAKLKQFQFSNFLQVQHYSEYKSTADFKKLMKISQDYLDRYSTELHEYWHHSGPSYVDYEYSVSSVSSIMKYLVERLIGRIEGEQADRGIKQYNKDIIILDYLITCKQLLMMIMRDNENYEKFAKKSRIEQIVEGATSQINSYLYQKIIDRARVMLDCDSRM